MIKVNGQELEVGKFPDGTLSIKVQEVTNVANIEWFYEPNEDTILRYVTKHLRRYHKVKELHLYMPYIPNARMDRVDDDDTIFTLKYFCEDINELNFDTVTVRDAHSNVAVGMLNNVLQESVTEVIKKAVEKVHIDKTKPFILFFPDEGAYKRYAKKLDYPSCFGIKSRVKGVVEELEVRGKLPTEPYDVLIVDDICSYGNTFIRAAQGLKGKGANDVYLYVTHCETNALKGELLKCGLVKKLYTTESIFTEEHNLVEVLGVR